MRTFKGCSKVKRCAGLQSLHVADADHVFVGGDDGRLVRTVDGGATWDEPATPFKHTIADLCGPPEDLHAVSFGGACHSDDGGTNWKIVKKAKRRAVVAATSGPGPRVALLEGGTLWWEGTDRSRWQPQKLVARYGEVTLHDVWSGNRAAWAGGHAVIMRVLRDQPPEAMWEGRYSSHIYALDGHDQTLIAVGAHDHKAIALRTHGDAFTLITLPSMPPDSVLRDVWSGGPGDWWAVGSPGLLLHSTDDGQTWQELDAPEEDLQCIDGVPDGPVWILGRKKLYRSEAP